MNNSDIPSFSVKTSSGMDSAVIFYVVAFILMVVVTVAIYYYFFKQYKSGQNTCTMLYPGTSLRMLRLREACKDNKRKTWAMPVAASLIG